ncbi:hypothetical protein HH1059_15510 [Halorhodospira halochloris]|uniref:Uncharacterized protein n=1 Tax=Halorhodospira halochloris TaxID=1052 RepID=A0A2Z6EZJ5_HALHR|nr:curli-like amyloid fiber formation chaperone CsgH [Halorhodospira halochloris]MBK1651966.1 hypothetical protein [Halorhodospira halochloris]BBE11090.1 hypothetical protein HH1059_15510 [Halorhodospira halochloris]
MSRIRAFALLKNKAHKRIALAIMLFASLIGKALSNTVAAEMSHIDPIEAKIEFLSSEDYGLLIQPKARAKDPIEVRYRIKVSASGVSGESSTSQGGSKQLDSTYRVLSTVSMRQQGEARFEAKLTLVTPEGEELRLSETYQQEVQVR